MPDPALEKKLNLKSGETLRLINAQDSFQQRLSPLSDESLPLNSGAADVVILFAALQTELSEHLPGALVSLKPGSRLWIAYPKKTSGIKSDISRDRGWDLLTKAGYEGVMLIALDDRWSAFRFRSVSEIKGLTRNAPVPKEQRPELTVPGELALLFDETPDAKAVFDGFAYTHRKEYVRWIEEAKKPETRAKRVEKAIEMIRQKKKLS